MGKIKLAEKAKKWKENFEKKEDSFTKFAKIKKKAKENMEGNWNKAAATTFISLVLSIVTTFVILVIFGYSVLQLGISYPVVENSENISTEATNTAESTELTTDDTSTSVPIQQAPDDYYFKYSILYIVFASIIFVLVYQLYNTIVSTIYSIKKEDEDLEFGTHFKNTTKNFAKNSKILGRKALKLIPSLLLLNFSYATYILGIYLTFLINDNWIILVLSSLVLSIVSVLLAISVLLNYTLTPFIVLTEPDMSSKNTLAKSKLLMRKNRKLFFDFILSFMGWAILSVITLGIGFIWLIPYYQLSKNYLFDEFKLPENIKNKENKKTKKLENNSKNKNKKNTKKALNK